MSLFTHESIGGRWSPLLGVKNDRKGGKWEKARFSGRIEKSSRGHCLLTHFDQLPPDFSVGACCIWAIELDGLPAQLYISRPSALYRICCSCTLSCALLWREWLRFFANYIEEVGWVLIEIQNFSEFSLTLTPYVTFILSPGKCQMISYSFLCFFAWQHMSKDDDTCAQPWFIIFMRSVVRVFSGLFLKCGYFGVSHRNFIGFSTPNWTVLDNMTAII